MIHATAEQRHHHGLQTDSACALCDQHPEAISHLILGYVYIWEVWTLILQRHGWEQLVPRAEATFADWWLVSRQQVSWWRRGAFDTLVLLIARGLWLQRNTRVFDRRGVPPTILARELEDECTL
jgi:hypothetical protein